MVAGGAEVATVAELREESEEKVWRKRSYRRMERRVEEESLIECVIKK